MIAESGQKLHPIEIKSGKTITSDWFKNILQWTTLAGEMAERPNLVYAGDKKQKRNNITIIDWKNCTKPECI